jgi:hypothetical protein
MTSSKGGAWLVGMERRTKCVLPGLGGIRRRGRAAIGLLMNIARRRYGGWKRSSGSFRSSSFACEGERQGGVRSVHDGASHAYRSVTISQNPVQGRGSKGVGGSTRPRSASTNSTARNTNASNADFTAGERTRSRNRATAVASGTLCVGGRFCHSKFCAALIALSITRSDFMEKERVKLWCAGSCE